MDLLILIALVLLNGVFAMSELAVVSSRKARLKMIADRGGSGATAALKLQEDPTPFLSTVQIGITLVGVASGAFGATALSDDLAPVVARTWPALAEEAGPIAFGLVIALTTYLSLVIGELVPKRIALTAPEAIASATAGPMTMLARVAHPLVWMLRVSTNGVLRIFGLHRQRPESVTEEEIRTLLAEGAASGAIADQEHTMMEGVMRLADRNVRSIMTPRPDIVWLDPDDPPDVTLATIATAGHSRYPVGRGDLDQILGVAQTKDLLVAAAQGRFDLAAAVRPVNFIPETLPVIRLLDSLQSSAVRMGLVVDEHGVVKGLVTVADMLGAIAGDSAFSVEDGLTPPTQREDGSWLIDGLTPLEDLRRLTGAGAGLEESADFSTVAGLVMHSLERVPEAGDKITLPGLTIEVLDMDGRRIDKVLVQVDAT